MTRSYLIILRLTHYLGRTERLIGVNVGETMPSHPKNFEVGILPRLITRKATTLEQRISFAIFGQYKNGLVIICSPAMESMMGSDCSTSPLQVQDDYFY